MIYLDGAYRRHRPEDIVCCTQLAVAAFPEFADRIECFGADWLGRQFATERGRMVGGRPQVLMLEPGTGEVLEITVDLRAFHDEELVQEADAAVAYSFFKQWLEAGGPKPGYDQCVGYKKPLYLGGVDEVTNLELDNFDVYWTISAQLLEQVRRLPVGTRINNISIED